MICFGKVSSEVARIGVSLCRTRAEIDLRQKETAPKLPKGWGGGEARRKGGESLSLEMALTKEAPSCSGFQRQERVTHPSDRCDRAVQSRSAVLQAVSLQAQSRNQNNIANVSPRTRRAGERNLPEIT